MRIAFVVKALSNPGGGAECILVQIANGLAARGHAVFVVTSDPGESTPYYELGEEIGHMKMAIGDVASRSSFSDMCNRVIAMRRQLSKIGPDIAVGFMHSSYLPLGLALLGSSIPVIASEHTSHDHFDKYPVQRHFLSLTPLLCEHITVVSEQVRQSFGERLRRRMVVVPNPVRDSIASEGKHRTANKNTKTLLTVGRLAPEKDHATLISAFASIVDRYPEWVLRIVGEGELRSTLEAQVNALGLTSSIEFSGARSDVGSEYAAADIFVMPSSYESFGLATAEALLRGLPAVGFADCPGTNELIQDQVNGRLVAGDNRVDALASVLASLMRDASERRRLSLSSRDWIRVKYGIDGALDRWERLLTDAIESVHCR